MAGPYGQLPELARTRWRAKVKITPNFSFARVDEAARLLSVCEQRNAALVRMTLGERKREVASCVEIW